MAQSQRTPGPRKIEFRPTGQTKFVICDYTIEVEYWILKEQLGLSDFRLWSYEAIERWYTLVYLVLAFLSWRSRLSGQSLSQVQHEHRMAHARSVLVSACETVWETGDLEGVLPRYLGQAA